jgi:hypothetical protein
MLQRVMQSARGIFPSRVFYTVDGDEDSVSLVPAQGFAQRSRCRAM